jgi:hypothetical protein
MRSEEYKEVSKGIGKALDAIMTETQELENTGHALLIGAVVMLCATLSCGCNRIAEAIEGGLEL